MAARQEDSERGVCGFGAALAPELPDYPSLRSSRTRGAVVPTKPPRQPQVPVRIVDPDDQVIHGERWD